MDYQHLPFEEEFVDINPAAYTVGYAEEGDFENPESEITYLESNLAGGAVDEYQEDGNYDLEESNNGGEVEFEEGYTEEDSTTTMDYMVAGSTDMHQDFDDEYINTREYYQEYALAETALAQEEAEEYLDDGDWQ
jgi:hypothetical protein